MAKVILKVGYNTYLLPDDVGLMAVVKALSRAVEVIDERIFKKGVRARENATLSVEISYLKRDEKIHWVKETKEEFEPEQLRLEAPTSIIIPPSK